MNKRKQQQAIVEALGWHPTPEGQWTQNPAGIATEQFPARNLFLPDYLENRNAIHGALTTLVMGNHYWANPLFPIWCQHLVNIVIRDSGSCAEADIDITDIYSPVEMCGAVAMATCEQLAESLIKTLDLWTDE
jgi:hypothetical protein